jgi:DNA-binding response OmpR family regulator
MRILLVEDDQRIRQDVTTALEAAGFVVDVEANGEEGWFLATPKPMPPPFSISVFPAWTA